MRRFLLALVLVLPITGCGERGSGTVVADTRTVAAFAEVEVSAGIEVEVRAGVPGDPSVVVHYDDNLIDNIETDVQDDRLVISIRGSLSTIGGERRWVEVTTDRLGYLEANSGASITATGTTETLELIAGSGADIDTTGIQASDVAFDAASGANVKLWASRTVTGEASSGADVDIEGNPERVNVDTSSGANVDY
jgi:hypothetical protein